MESLSNYSFKGKYKVGDVLHVLLRNYENNCWDRGFYEVLSCSHGSRVATKGFYYVQKIAGEGSQDMTINVVGFDSAVLSCYGNTKDGTLDPTLKVLYGKET